MIARRKSVVTGRCDLPLRGVRATKSLPLLQHGEGGPLAVDEVLYYAACRNSWQSQFVEMNFLTVNELYCTLFN